MSSIMIQSLMHILFYCSLLMVQIRAHGFLASPRSRNFVAREDGINRNKASIPGIPYVEYCHSCLTRNTGVCGLSIHDHNYDDWLDSAGSPMPWIPQATYEEGSIIQIHTTIKAHHWGHIEMSACPDGRLSTQDCFDQHRLTFVRDLSHDMPFDPKHPERGYLAMGEEFIMEFKLPDNVAGDNVLLQWRYVTANSCNPEGYPAYFGGQNEKNRLLPKEYWNSKLNVCYYPLPLDGSRGFRKPEQFFNCAEITILQTVDTVVSTTVQDRVSSIVSSVIPEKTNDLEVMSETSNQGKSSTLYPTTRPNVSPMLESTTSPTISPVLLSTTSPPVSPVTLATTSPSTSQNTKETEQTNSPVISQIIANEIIGPTPRPVTDETMRPVYTETQISTISPVNTISAENDLMADELCCPRGYSGMQFTMGCTHYFKCTAGKVDSDINPCPYGASPDDICDSSDISSCDYVPCTIEVEDDTNDVEASADVEEAGHDETDSTMSLLEESDKSLDAVPSDVATEASGVHVPSSLIVFSLVLLVQAFW